MRISNMIELIGKISSNAITVNQERCVLVRNRNADCLRCAEACVSGCISYGENELIVNPLVCIGCGTCATMCPTAALEVKNPDDRELLVRCEKAAAATEGTVVVICDRMAEKAGRALDLEKVVIVPCLGRIEESVLCTLAADGVERVVLCDALCDGCDYENGREAAQLVRDTTQTLLDTWHQDMELRIAEKLPRSVRRADAGYDANKRAAFESVGAGAASAAGEVAEAEVKEHLGEAPGKKDGPVYLHVDETGVLPHFVPDRRHQLLDALGRMGEPDDIMFDTRLWGHVIVDPDKCRSCYMCATFCPTGAMRKILDEDGVAHGVGHYPGHCVKCHTCENICMGHAITISEEVFATDMLAGMVDRIDMESQDFNHMESWTLHIVEQERH